MDMLEWLNYWLSTDNTKLIYVISLILIANVLDFSIGWVNAKLNDEVAFSSSKAIYGIARKMFVFILLIFFIPFSLLVPEPIGISALYVLYMGYLLSEVTSILNHLKLGEDDKTNDMFMGFINKVMKGGK